MKINKNITAISASDTAKIRELIRVNPAKVLRDAAKTVYALPPIVRTLVATYRP